MFRQASKECLTFECWLKLIIHFYILFTYKAYHIMQLSWFFPPQRFKLFAFYWFFKSHLEMFFHQFVSNCVHLLRVKQIESRVGVKLSLSRYAMHYTHQVLMVYPSQVQKEHLKLQTKEVNIFTLNCKEQDWGDIDACHACTFSILQKYLDWWKFKAQGTILLQSIPS